MQQADEEPRRLPELKTDVDDRDNLVTCVCPSGGAGLSVTASLLALSLGDRGRSCALVDADCMAGGLDVLLGIEREQGMRMSGIEAPLGKIEGEALVQELPCWQNVRVLGSDPWNGGAAQWWEVQAAIDALVQTQDVVVVDAGRGACLDQIPALARSPMLMLVELTVLGLARARSMMKTIARTRGRGNDPEALWLLGMHPRGSPQRSRRIGVAQAADYLGHEIVAALHPRTALAGALLDGVGIAKVPREYRRTFEALANGVEAVIGRGAA